MPLHGAEGIETKILWPSESADTIVGLIRLKPGSADAVMRTRSDSARMGHRGTRPSRGPGRRPGSSVSVPLGAGHHTASVGPRACDVLCVPALEAASSRALTGE